ncbi:hypothetical protein ANCDUO_11984 [Ancylostoma duodenale]|uniref:Uncharacterized protein n=1 Tax=Ancylostoma duodenale TaxID=51022 RepID=A0A0C2GL73_9BILA|nr:hypothetical protein ANCDUO_11984 [Ancylostoma duodenale]
MQARKIRYDVIGLTETRRHRPLNATFDTGEELFLGTCDSRGVGGVGVFVNTNLAMNIDSFEQLTTRIGRLRLRRCGSISPLKIFVAYAPTSSFDDEEIEAFYMDLEKIRSACSTSLRQRKESRGFKIHQKTTVLRDPRADTPAWSRESRRQLSTNVRARKTVQRSDKRRP